MPELRAEWEKGGHGPFYSKDLWAVIAGARVIGESDNVGGDDDYDATT